MWDDEFRPVNVSIQIPSAAYDEPAPPFWRSPCWRTTEFALVAAAAIGMWFGDGDATRTYGAAAFGVVFAALGLFSSTRKLIAFPVLLIVAAALFLECRFVIKLTPENVTPVQNQPPATEPHASNPPRTAASPSPAPPTSNEQKPAPAPQALSPEEAAVQLGAWSSLLPRTNDLVISYNALDLVLSQWESKLGTEDGSAKLAKDLREGAAKMVSASHSVETIAGEYPQLAELNATLSGSPAGKVSMAANALADAVSKKQDVNSEMRLLRLRQLAGALRLQMGAMVNWMSNVSRTANVKVRDLSGVK